MTDLEAEGLATSEAQDLLARFGPNEPARERRSPLAQIAPFLGNPLAIVLLVASGLSALLGDTVDAVLIAGLVLLSVVINFVQTWRSQRAAEQLRARVAPTATVLRDGAWREIPRREVVPGDIIRLGAGDLVPADARLLAANDLHVHEAALTGESLPAEKEVSAVNDDRRGTVWLGTSIVSGSATARVTATGSATQFGDVVVRLSARPPETEFERGLRHFGMLITRTVLVLVLVLLAVSVAMHKPAFESLLFAVALAVGLTPEFLPMITTVTLAQGASRMAREHVIVKHLSAIQNLGSIDVLCSDKTGTLTAGEMGVAGSYDANGQESPRALGLARLNSRLETGIKSPLDVAILAAVAPDEEGWTKLDEVPFDFQRRRLSVVVGRGTERLMITKGAPDALCELVKAFDTAQGVSQPADDAARTRWRQWLARMGEQGMRVLAVAWKDAGEQVAWRASDEHDMVLAGFLTFSDPPLSEAAAAVDGLRNDGVAVKVLTGDDAAVACHVCEAVGIDVGTPLLGVDIDRMSDSALAPVAERTAVFARISPSQKTRILLALKRRGHVVGFIGDGINDAPSLHAADVGISVPHAVDIAREAADIILTERGLDVLHGGILAGRRAFGNVTKYLLMGTSSNFGNMLSMAAASLLLPFLPMLPTQILLNNLLYDVSQISIPTDDVDPSWLRRPHRSDIALVRRFMLFVGPISSIFDFLTFYVLLHFFHAKEALFHTGWFVESLCTQTLVLFVIRTFERPWKSRPSVPLTVTVFAVVGFGAALPAMPFAKVLGFVPMPLSYIGFVAAATVAYLGVVELVKEALVRRGAFVTSPL
ncbi:MAG: magnesium-translocating P-type ATPase [Polyangiaceae bacterium]|jgi:P-type Mg2+ transporter